MCRSGARSTNRKLLLVFSVVFFVSRYSACHAHETGNGRSMFAIFVAVASGREASATEARNKEDAFMDTCMAYNCGSQTLETETCDAP